MSRRKQNGRSAPRVDRIRFEAPDPFLRRRLARGGDVVAGSRELRRRNREALERVA